MFGMSFSEIMIIAVIAVLFLGPDKLPSTMVQIAKFFKSFKGSIDTAKNSFEQEMKIQELKEETLAYKEKLDTTAQNVRQSISFDELNEIKRSTKGVTDTFNDIQNNIEKVKDIKSDPLGVKKAMGVDSKKEDKGEDV